MERLLQYFEPEAYILDLTFSRQSETIEGLARIHGTVIDDSCIKLHAVNMEILNISYSAISKTQSHHDKQDSSREAAEQSSCEFTYDGQILTIPITASMREQLNHSKNTTHLPNSTAQHSEIELFIQFKTKITHNMQGCYLSTYQYHGAEQKLITTQFESHYAREAFPCIDEPAAKATFSLQLTVSDLTAQDVVLANTTLLERKGQQFIFEQTPRMSTYLLAWVIGPLQSVTTTNQHGVTVTSYAALNQTATSLEFANEVAARSLDYYNEQFGIKYPLSKLDQVALPDFEAGAMENWGLVTYRESCLLAEANASIDTKQSVAITVTHELSHQWFGNLVTMAWWDDLWLNESFATVMEYYATEALYPEFQAWQEFFTGDCIAALRRDCLPGVQSVQQAVHDPAEIATLFDGAIVYAKGARLILMLIRLMGAENFYRGVHDYFVEYQYNNTVGDDLWRKLQPYADFNVKDFMHAWISQPGYPALERLDERATDPSQKPLWQQRRFLINGASDDTTWPLPEIKDDMSGHYLIDLSDTEFHQKLDNFEQLDAEQKLRLLIDRMLLAKADAVSSASLLELLPKFTDENAPIWDILLSIINDLKIFFPHTSTTEDQYRTFLRRTIHDRMRAVGVQSQPSESSDAKRLRAILSAIARFAKDSEIITELAALYNDNLSTIDADMRGNILMAKMATDEATVFPLFLQKYQNEVDPELRDDLLCAIAAAKSDQHITTVIHLLEQPEIVRPQDHLFLYIYILRNAKARERGLDWFYHHWDLVKTLAGDKSVEDYPRCMAGYINTEAEAQQFNDFFRPYEDSPILKRALAMAKVGIQSKLSLMAKQSASVQAKLQELLG